ncbi:MAG TPA: carboxyl transferase domain-containing protein, partial [Acidimicrobiales bacterium]|nr:carboxyl transferase domain-containing protein [Acidimicrobiales bacterium]
RAHVPGTIRAALETMGGRAVMVARSVSGHHRGALTRADGDTIAEAARVALRERLPLVVVLSSSGSEVAQGVDALHGWGGAAAAMAACSGVVPVLAAVTGAAISGPALLLGLADVTVMTPDAFAFVSGPDAVEGFTGMRVGLHDLGGATVHATASGLCALLARDEDAVAGLLGAVLVYLPDHTDAEPPTVPTDDPGDRATPALRDLVPAAASASYDVRDVVRAVADDGELLELRPAWAPQLVTALSSVGGMPVGVVANQPRSLAGTLDIPASQKGARFVRFCDAFNLPIVTLVDTPGFLPGKDLEWRGMIRHGAELAFAYAEATVPRVCVVLRKAFGGAYIVMDSKGIGNDLCLAWPSAQIAVMGAGGAAQILGRGSTDDERRALEEDYRTELLTPWVAAERGFVDAVIDPADTRRALHRALVLDASRRERLPGRKHDAGPM